MYLIECVNAYTAILALAEQECDYKTAYALVTLKRRLQPQIDFFTQKEMELVRLFAAKTESGDVALNDRGNFIFADPSKANEYAKRRTELGMVEVQGHLDPVRMPTPPSIKPIHLEALEGFVIFEDGDGK